MRKVFLYLSSISAATAIEYAILASGIALTIVSVLIIFGNDLNNLYYDLLPSLLN